MCTLLPHLNASSLITKTTDSPISLKFMLTLLKYLLGSVYNETSDWASLKFEPITLLVTCGDLLHECELIWDADVYSGCREPVTVEEKEEWIVELGTRKLEVKVLVIECLQELSKLLQEPACGLTDTGMRFMQY